MAYMNIKKDEKNMLLWWTINFVLVCNEIFGYLVAAHYPVKKL